MDPVLSSLFPVNQIGSDGFSWWIGQIETNKEDDPKKAGRYRVRIVGQHLKNCDAVPTNELPWAAVMMPATTPYSDGGVTGASINLRQGNWVVGFYLDNDKQKPIIMGSVPHTPGSTTKVNTDPSPGETCKAFTTYIDPETNPTTDFPEAEQEGVAVEDNEVGYQQGSNITGAEPVAASRSAEKGGLPPALQGVFGKNSETNPTGGQFCVVIANPNCGSESDLKSGLTKIVGELLAANQASNGQLGDYYVGKATGALNDQLGSGRTYINKAVRLVKSFVARAKGEIISELRSGIKTAVDYSLYETIEEPIVPEDINRPLTADEKNAVQGLQEVILIAEENGDTASAKAAEDEYNKLIEQINASRGHPTIKKKESRLKEVQKAFDGVLKDLGCTMGDIADKISQWLTDLLLGYLMDAYSAAACLIDQLINGIINELFGYIEQVISDVLSSIQVFLGDAAQAVNIISGALSRIMSLLGISCSGPEAQCEKIQIKCTDCSTNEDQGDFLDNLIKEVEQGDIDFNDSVCTDATFYEEVPETTVSFVGGTFVTPGSTATTGSSSIYYTINDITVQEGNTGRFVISRSGDVTQASSIRFYPKDLTATYGSDYRFVTPGNILTFAAGETEQYVDVEVLTDTVTEGDEVFGLQVSEDYTPVDKVAIFNGYDFVCTITEYPVPLSPTSSTASSSATTSPTTSTSATPTSTSPSITSVASVSGYSTTSSPVSLTPTYTVVPDKNFLYEGQSVTFTITTTNVADGTSLNYTISGTDIDASDFVSSPLTGSVTITSNVGTVTVQTAINDDDLTSTDPDLSEDFVFTLDSSGASAAVTILGGASTVPLYAVSADKSYVLEGEEITYTITTLNVADGTVLNYTLSGTDITVSDVDGGTLTGSTTINSNTATVKIKVSSDTIIENAETLRFSIDTTSAFVDVVIAAQASLNPITPALTIPSYSVTSDKTIYDEGEDIVFTITTTNVSDGTVVYYTLFGDNITSTDFIPQSLTGSVAISNNTGTVVIGIANDTSIESSETVTFSLNGTGATSTVNINAQTSPVTPPKPVIPCLTKPSASVLTDESGKIISIQIDDRGCPYSVKPQVIISGNGYGAAAIPLLDADGYISEIRVTRTGLNYKPKPPTNLNCIIDSFTMIRPGGGYTSEPRVFINGNANIARAKVENGFVVSVEILDRTIKFDTVPKVQIIGGGGYGAKFLPSLQCIDIAELERRGYAKIGTGKYIDCP